eukprot:gene9363-11501_t
MTKNNNNDDTIIKHSFQLYFKRVASTQYRYHENVESFEVHFNNNNGGGDKRIKSSVFPTVTEPTVQIIETFKDNSPQTKVESYSTVKTLAFNDSVRLCDILEPFIGITLLPCSNSSDVGSISHMGLIPPDLDAPFFMNNPQFESVADENESKKTNKKPKRYIQKSLPEDTDFSLKGWLGALSSFDLPKPAEIDFLPWVSPYHVSTASSISIGFFAKFTIEETMIKVDYTEMVRVNGNENILLHAQSHAGQPEIEKKITLIHKSTKEIYDSTSLSSTSTPSSNIVNLSDQPEPTITNKDYSDWEIEFKNRQVQKQGFHRELFSSFVLKNNNKRNVGDDCQVLFFENFDQGIYVDKYEVDEITRFGGPKVVIYYLIDLEKPSTSSTQNHVSVIKSFKTSDNLEMNITLPIHLRYQNPSNVSENRQTTIYPPNVYLKCDGKQDWKRVDIILSSNLGPQTIDIPVGQLINQSTVSFLTLVVTVLGSLIVVFSIVFTSGSNSAKSTRKSK